MIVVRIFAQLLIAAALMLLGYDALRALETGGLDPVTFSGLAVMLGEAAGLSADLDFEAGLRTSETLPGLVQTSLLFVVTSPGFVVFAIVGIMMAWLFRTRG